MFAIVTELLSGGSFAERVRAGVTPEQTRRWMGQLASALAYMHDLKMQHRDLKSDNVLFDAAGRTR